MAHPAVGGKGLPPVVSAPVYIPSSPAASSVVSGYAPPSHHHQSYHATTAGPPPDLTVRIQLKLRYLRLRGKYNRSIEVRSALPLFTPPLTFGCSVSWLRTDRLSNGRLQARKDLEIELAEKEATQQRLQDEVEYVLLSFDDQHPPLTCVCAPRLPWHSLIIDQIYDSDYAHLLPKRDSLFSDDDEEEEYGSADEEDEAEPAKVKAEEDGGAATETKDRKGKRKMEERDLDELEAERRTELEARYGIDGTRRNVRVRLPCPRISFVCLEWRLKTSCYRSRSRACRPLHRRQRRRRSNRLHRQLHPSCPLHYLPRPRLRHIRLNLHQADQYRWWRNRPLRLRRRNGSSSSLVEEAARDEQLVTTSRCELIYRTKRV